MINGELFQKYINFIENINYTKIKSDDFVYYYLNSFYVILYNKINYTFNKNYYKLEHIEHYKCHYINNIKKLRILNKYIKLDYKSNYREIVYFNKYKYIWVINNNQTKQICNTLYNKILSKNMNIIVKIIKYELNFKYYNYYYIKNNYLIYIKFNKIKNEFDKYQTPGAYDKLNKYNYYNINICLF